MTHWVLDTCLLYHASGCGRPGASVSDADQSHAALLALALLARSAGHDIAEDCHGRVDTEYGRCWKKLAGDKRSFPSKDAVHTFWFNLWSRHHAKVEGSIPNTVRELLRENNLKEDGDIAFVEAAAGTASKLLVTEDGDYTKDVRERLAAVLGVTVLGYGETYDEIPKR